MGRKSKKQRNHWAKYKVGRYSLGQLNGRATVNWSEGGKQKRRLLDANTEKQGRSALDQFVSKRENKLKNTTLKCGELFKDYLADREQDGKQAVNMLNSWKALAPRFINVQVSLIDADMCRAHAKERFDLGMAQATVWTELTQLRTIINWGADHKKYPRSQKPYIWRPNKGKGRQRVMTSDEVHRWMEHAQWPHLKLFFIIALATGARSTAILQLTWDRVNFDRGEIDFLVPENIDPMKKVVRKGRATVGMDMVVRVALMEAFEGRTCEHVVEWNSKPIKRISKAFKKCCDNAKIEGVSPHIIRHSCATFGLESGVPIEVISKLLGHSNLEITYQIYAHATPKLLAQATSHVNNLIDTTKIIEMEETSFFEYLIAKYKIEAEDAEKLRNKTDLSEQFTYFDVSEKGKTAS